MAGLTARLFVWPSSGYPDHADAVVMLSGDHGERLRRALELMEQGVSSTFVHAGEPDTPEARLMCRDGASFEVVCLQPDPDSTRDEARAVGDLARARGWRTLVLVTSTQHVTRASLLFRRCVDGTVGTAHAPVELGRSVTMRVILDEWLALGHALTFGRGC